MNDGTVSPILDDITARFERMLKQTVELKRRLSQWAADKPQSKACLKHKFTRRIDWDLSAHQSHVKGDFVLVYQRCPACVKEDEIRRNSEWLRQRGVPGELCHATFENFIAENEVAKKALDGAKKFAKKKRGFFILLGDVGLGKTHLAVAIMREVGKGLLVTNESLMEKLSENYNDPRSQRIIAVCKKTPFLILDEAGISRGGKDELPAIHAIFNHRHGEKLPTVITTNLPQAGLYEFIGPRVTDRLRESTFAMYELVGESRRAQMKEDYFRD